ncbi:hypothetical protein ACFQFC_00870 [Amorphoplanes digitatis]|uniref:DUF5666 domain-containing protein n=1 Tax=Actinoplanes digitatis TaxID=1868 RepID=A0A7W7HXS3_9ACTN|nr:hypothetical protein [Actinoplanes digitatis]MBB4762729.1 hypothetical protein [Actinoplanes digitatis]GID91775.1 hypothetical protein Adi01nite_11870 [Actinoplanes digitatis]
MRLPRTAAAAVLAAGIIVPAVSGAAVALASPSSHSVVATKHGHEPGGSEKPGKPHKPRKPVRIPFAANGKVTAVDAEAGTVTLAAHGGTKDVRRKTITVKVPEGARIRVNGRRATVAGILAGAKITVTGLRVDGVYTAVVINANRPKPAKPPVTPSPSVTPSTDVSPSPSVTPSTDVTPSPTGSAAPTPSVSPSADPDDQ